MSDQFRTDTLITRPPREKLSDTTDENGHGPAMQDTRAFRNSFNSPASSDAEAVVAFQRPSGEQGCLPWHG